MAFIGFCPKDVVEVPENVVISEGAGKCDECGRISWSNSLVMRHAAEPWRSKVSTLLLINTGGIVTISGVFYSSNSSLWLIKAVVFHQTVITVFWRNFPYEKNRGASSRGSYWPNRRQLTQRICLSSQATMRSWNEPSLMVMGKCKLKGRYFCVSFN